MLKQRRTRGVLATSSGREKMAEAKAKKRWSNDTLAIQANSNEKTVNKFLNGSARIDPSSAHSIIAALELEYSDVVSPIESLTSQSIEELEKVSDNEQAAQLVQGLEASVTQYQELEEIESKSIQWLEVNSAEMVSVSSIEGEILEMLSSSQIDQEIDPEILAKDLQTYVELIQCSLELGSLRLIDSAIDESLMPDTYDVEIYVHFLNFIKSHAVLNNAPLSVSNKILNVLNYIINVVNAKM
jgi:hypothetical protein